MRIGLVGYGVGGRNFHAPLITTTAGCSLAGVVTRSPERRAELVEDLPGVQAFDSLADLAAAGVDAVVISTPPDTRQNLILEAISLGLAVVSDKPFALDEGRARQLVNAAKDAGVMLSVYMNRRWDSDYLTVRKLLETGELGRIRRFYSGIEAYQPGNKGNASGGGLVRDLGSHLVDQAYHLLGPVMRVYAEVDFMPFDDELNDAFYFCLEHASGVISHINGFMEQHAPGPRFKVDGTEGSFTIEGLDVQTEQAFARRTPATEGDKWGVEDPSRWGWIQRQDQRQSYPSERGCWDQFYKRLLAAFEGRGPAPVDPLDAIEVTRILDAARISARERRIVPLD